MSIRDIGTNGEEEKRFISKIACGLVAASLDYSSYDSMCVHGPMSRHLWSECDPQGVGHDTLFVVG